MSRLILQAQLLLTAISALLPLVPHRHQARVGEVLGAVNHALAAGNAIAANAEDLSEKLASIRREIETIAADGRAIDAAALDGAMARVHAASADFRDAIAAAGAG